MTTHERDADCIVLANGTCRDCGVYHGDACPECTGRGYHEACCSVSALNALAQTESALGDNLVWITDNADLRVRQGDIDALNRLAQLRHAWHQALRVLRAHGRTV